jgi:hypothetical protein
MVTTLMGLLFLSGCANLPPLIQKHSGMYGLYLPTGPEMTAAMLYRQDANFTVPGGEICTLEHNVLNGHVRFLYPNASYIAMHGWKNMRYVSSRMLPDGQVMALFQGTVNGQAGTEEMAMFGHQGVVYVALGTGGIEYAPTRITENRILFRQTSAANPLMRVYEIPQRQVTMPVRQSVVEQRVAAIREQNALLVQRQEAQQRALREREAAARQQEQDALVNSLRAQRLAERETAARQQAALRQGHAQMVVQAISIQGGAVPVQARVPAGHQNVAPQTVNLQ